MTLQAEISAFLARHNISKSRFGTAATGDPSFVSRLSGGREPTPETQSKARDWMARYEAGQVTLPPKRHGGGRVPRPMPDDFPARAATMTNAELGDHYGATLDMITRWKKGAGIARPLSSAPPANLAALASRMTLSELTERFSVSPKTIRRWCSICGVKPQREPARRTTRAPGTGWQGQPARVINATPITSRAEDAARFLQRFGAVYRCGQTGRPAVNGDHWNRGGHVLSDADVIARAERLGWNPDAWRMVG